MRWTINKRNSTLAPRGLNSKIQKDSNVTLQELTDREALRELVAAYCRAVDRQDLALMRRLYHPDAYHDHGDLFRGTRDAFIAWLEKSLGNMVSHHFIGNLLLSVTGDRAEGEVYSINTHVLPGTPAREYIAGGRYLDEYIRVGGAWLFKRRERVIDWSHERVAAPGGPSDKILAGVSGSDDRSFAALPQLVARLHGL